MFAWTLATILPLCGQATSAQPPGPESFAKKPETPTELWDAIDYLVRVGQAEKAVPYLTSFLKTNPDDAMFVFLRSRYGAGSFLRLTDHESTRELGTKLVERMAAASSRNAVRPERIAEYVAGLTKTPIEHRVAIDELLDAGPYAVPAIAAELAKSDLPAGDRAKINQGLSELDRSAVPPLVALLDSSNPNVSAPAASALGRIGDPRAIPSLTIAAALPNIPATVQAAARTAIERITGRSFSKQPQSPLRLLADEAWKYERHQRNFPSDQVELWKWTDAKGLQASSMSISGAEETLGLFFARAALAIDPNDLSARVALVSLALEKAILRSGIEHFSADDPSRAQALAAGPVVLGEVLRNAIADRKSELGAVTATLIGKSSTAADINKNNKLSRLLDGLKAPDRRTQFASARALVLLNPRLPFPGSSQVVPTLARFLVSQKRPRGVVIDSSSGRANLMASYLQKLGYDTATAVTGAEGFEIAARTADVEIVLIEPSLFGGSWRLADLLANLRGDARTASLPIVLYGPRNFEVRLWHFLRADKYLFFVIIPQDAVGLERQFNRKLPAMHLSPLSQSERDSYASGAATLLATIAARPGGAFEPDLAEYEPALGLALLASPTPVAGPIALALGDVASVDAQRSLADAVLDPSRPDELRLTAADRLVRSIQRFGRLVSATQEARLAATFDQTPTSETNLHAALEKIIAALRPTAESLRNSATPPDPAPSYPGRKH